MRRAGTDWLGASAALLAALALGACGSKGHATATGKGGATTTTTGTTTTTTIAAGTGGTGGAPPMVGDSVLMHHRSPSHDGVYAQPTFTKAAVAGMTRDTTFYGLVQGGAMYSQPLFVDGLGGTDLVVVATSFNDVVALDAATGKTAWLQHLGTPVPLAKFLCGNIDPYGVTGTPVIDLASRTVFLNAMTTPDDGTTKRHLIFALSLDTGEVRPGWPVDTTVKAKSGALAFDPQSQGQRGALAVVNGWVYVPYGGLAGDCGVYHGWVVAVSIADPTQVKAWATPAVRGGSWTPGGIASDGTSIYISTGETQDAGTVWNGGEAMIRFSSGAAFGAPTGFFAPKDWSSLAAADLDMGTAPVLFDLPGSTPSQLAVVFGKDGKVYLLDRNALGGVSDPLATAQVASGHIISAPAVYTTAKATYVVTGMPSPLCAGNNGDLLAIKILPGSPPTIAPAWCAQAGDGSPMVTTTDGHAEAVVWSIGWNYDQRLHGFDGDTGASIFTSPTTLPEARRYNVPIAAKGRLFVCTDGVIWAFKP